MANIHFNITTNIGNVKTFIKTNNTRKENEVKGNLFVQISH